MDNLLHVLPAIIALVYTSYALYAMGKFVDFRRLTLFQLGSILGLTVMVFYANQEGWIHQEVPWPAWVVYLAIFVISVRFLMMRSKLNRKEKHDKPA